MVINHLLNGMILQVPTRVVVPLLRLIALVPELGPVAVPSAPPRFASPRVRSKPGGMFRVLHKKRFQC